MHVRLLLGLLAAGAIFAQTADEDFKIYTEHPRLLLKAQRLKLLRRESERRSQRWQQLEALVLGKVQMPEPGFAFALVYQVNLEEGVGRQAIAWALTPAATDLRQLALVYDWCQPLLKDTEAKTLRAKLQKSMEQTAKASDIAAVRSRVFAAIALEDDATLKNVVTIWWRKQVAPALKGGTRTLTRAEVYPMIEIQHAIRDTVNVEMREDAAKYFQELPAYLLLSYYPAVYPAAENDYRVPVYSGTTEPDLKAAAFSRAAELSIVSYDPNAVESQFLQGWLIHDKFMMRGVQGICYEFLWANPYQPGLSYFHMPLKFHDTRNGRLFIRSSWDDDATWLGYFDGKVQLFEDGRIQPLSLQTQKEPTMVGDNAVLLGSNKMKLDLDAESPTSYFIIGLKPHQNYLIEADDEELTEEETDAGGILALNFKRKDKMSVRIMLPPGKKL
ncbi:MAG: hypothetical protein ABJF23_18945 [Bryobacteraceae bacterium]